MKNTWIGLAIVAFGIYSMVRGETLEAAMYFSVGSGFSLIGILMVWAPVGCVRELDRSSAAFATA